MARGPQIHQMVRATVTAAMAVSLLLLAPGPAAAGEDDPSGSSRSTAPTQGYTEGSTTPVDGFAAGALAKGTTDSSTTSIDGFAAAAMAAETGEGSSLDGWAHRSPPAPIRDGWEVARIELPRPVTVTDGWAYRSTPSISRDGWEVARIELPRPVTVTDGWAFRSDTTVPDLSSLDGWAYGSVTGREDPVQVATSPAPPRQTSPPFAEIALAATVALLVAAGAGFMHYRHQHHLPV